MTTLLLFFRAGWGLAALAAATLLVGCNRKGAPAAAASTAPKPLLVEAAEVVVRTVPLTVESVGNLEARSRVALVPLVNARIEAVLARDGATVAAGAELVRLDARSYLAAQRRAEADRASRAAQLDSLSSRLERSQESITAGLLSPQQAQDLRNEIAQAQAALQSAEAMLQQTGLDLENCVLRAPFAGRVGLVNAIVGAYVTTGSATLLEVRALDPLEVNFHVPEIALGTLRREAGAAPLKVTVRRDGANQQEAIGTLAAFENKVDQRTRSLGLRASLPNADTAFWPGEFVNVTLTLGEVRDALLVPLKALNTGPNGPYLYVIADGKARLRAVEPGAHTGELVIIRKGIAAGEKVIVSGQLGLQDGSAVQIAAAAETPARTTKT